MVEYPQAKIENKFSIATVPYAHGFVINNDGADAVVSVFVRGPRVFLIETVTPRAVKASEAEIELTRRLVAIQAAKTPSRPAKIHNLGAQWFQAEMVLGTLGAAMLYIGGLSFVAWLRDPLRRHRTSPIPQPTALPNLTTVDVTTRAHQRRRRAVVKLVLELSGTVVTTAGIVSLQFSWFLGLLLAALGIGMIWIPRLATATARHAVVESKLWTGRRRLRVSCYATISTVFMLTGLLVMVLSGVGTVMISPTNYNNILLFFVAVVFLVAGALIRRRARRARRLAALDADEVLRRDRRPMANIQPLP
jgi:hypothetical protein